MRQDIDEGRPRPARRDFLGGMGAGVAALTAASVARPASAQADPVGTAGHSVSRDRPARTRTVPGTGQTLTTLGLGTFLTFDAKPGDDRTRLREVFRRYVEGGEAVSSTPRPSTARPRFRSAPFSPTRRERQTCSWRTRSGRPANTPATRATPWPVSNSRNCAPGVTPSTSCSATRS